MNSDSPNRPAANQNQAQRSHPQPRPEKIQPDAEPRSGRPDDVNPSPEHHWNDAGPDDPSIPGTNPVPRQDRPAKRGGF